MCLAQGNKAVMPVRLEPLPLGRESSTLPLSKCAPVPILTAVLKMRRISLFQRDPEADPGFVERGFVCKKVWGSHC